MNILRLPHQIPISLTFIIPIISATDWDTRPVFFFFLHQSQNVVRRPLWEAVLLGTQNGLRLDGVVWFSCCVFPSWLPSLVDLFNKIKTTYWCCM